MPPFPASKSSCGPAGSEVPTEHIGELVMNELRKLDKVAYVRFASVYKSFEDIGEFVEAIRDAGALAARQAAQGLSGSACCRHAAARAPWLRFALPRHGRRPRLLRQRSASRSRSRASATRI